MAELDTLFDIVQYICYASGVSECYDFKPLHITRQSSGTPHMANPYHAAIILISTSGTWTKKISPSQLVPCMAVHSSPHMLQCKDYVLSPITLFVADFGEIKSHNGRDFSRYKIHSFQAFVPDSFPSLHIQFTPKYSASDVVCIPKLRLKIPTEEFCRAIDAQRTSHSEQNYERRFHRSSDEVQDFTIEHCSILDTHPTSCAATERTYPLWAHKTKSMYEHVRHVGATGHG